MKKTSLFMLVYLIISTSPAMYCSDSSALDKIQAAWHHPITQNVVKTSTNLTVKSGQFAWWALQKSYQHATQNTQTSSDFYHTQEEFRDEISETSSSADFTEMLEGQDFADYEDVHTFKFYKNQKELQKNLEIHPAEVQNKLNEALQDCFQPQKITKTMTQHQLRLILKLVKKSKTESTAVTLAPEIANLYNLPQASEVQNFVQTQTHKQEEIEAAYQRTIDKAVEILEQSLQSAIEKYREEKKTADEWHARKLEKSYKKASIRGDNALEMNKHASRKIDAQQAQNIKSCTTPDEFQKFLIGSNQEIRSIINTYTIKIADAQNLIESIENVTQKIKKRENKNK